MSLIEPPIDDLVSQVDSKYTLVVMTARRAREINSYYVQLGEGIGEYVPPLVSNADPTRKALSIAMDEMQEQKLTYWRDDD